MHFDILTIFPEMFESPLNESILKRGQQKGLVEYRLHDIRQFATDKHHKVDEVPYGGGAGMVMMAPPVVAAIESIERMPRSKRILLTPRGRVLTQEVATELSQLDQLILVCGRYEGIDERIAPWIDDELSIGDFVMSGGELAAMVVVDTVTRLVPGVLGNPESLASESHGGEGLEYPHYTRPFDFRGVTVPEVLLSGHHEEIRKWREHAARQLTERRRPDLIKKGTISEE